jgi:hypothetical protein
MESFPKVGDHYRHNIGGWVVQIQFSDQPNCIRYGWEEGGDWKTSTIWIEHFRIEFSRFS